MNASVPVPANKPLSLTSQAFADNKFEIYRHLRAHQPVHHARIMGMKLVVAARYDDCLTVLKDPRFIRNRAAATGGSRYPFPIPGNLKFLTRNMILEDDPEHRRLRALVQKAFSPKALNDLQSRVEQDAHTLLDVCLARGECDLQQDYGLPIPERVIAAMLGVDPARLPEFRQGMRVLSDGLSGFSMLRTLFWDLRKAVNLVKTLIEQKRAHPGDDILTRLIEAEEDGEQLDEDELVSMVFLLIVAGFETTVHLISNGVLALIQHPEQQALLRAEPDLVGSAVEEMLRFCGPVHGTKMNYAAEDLELRGVHIPRGMPVMPLLGSANRDEQVFDLPDEFDIRRDPNKHLAFSQGNHFCLGAFLARMEAKVAFTTLLARTESIELAVPSETLHPSRMPGWHRYPHMPAILKSA